MCEHARLCGHTRVCVCEHVHTHTPGYRVVWENKPGGLEAMARLSAGMLILDFNAGFGILVDSLWPWCPQDAGRYPCLVPGVLYSHCSEPPRGGPITQSQVDSVSAWEEAEASGSRGMGIRAVIYQSTLNPKTGVTQSHENRLPTSSYQDLQRDSILVNGNQLCGCRLGARKPGKRTVFVVLGEEP